MCYNWHPPSNKNPLYYWPSSKIKWYHRYDIALSNRLVQILKVIDGNWSSSRSTNNNFWWRQSMKAYLAFFFWITVQVYKIIDIIHKARHCSLNLVLGHKLSHPWYVRDTGPPFNAMGLQYVSSNIAINFLHPKTWARLVLVSRPQMCEFTKHGRYYQNPVKLWPIADANPLLWIIKMMCWHATMDDPRTIMCSHTGNLLTIWITFWRIYNNVRCSAGLIYNTGVLWRVHYLMLSCTPRP